MPDYPPLAEPAGIAGKAKVEVSVDSKGFVTGAKLLSEDPQGFGFGEAALVAGRRWTFEPGRPGSFRITMTFAPSDGREPVNLADLPEAPQPVDRVSPNYPEAAESADVNGDARIAVAIANDGNITQTWVALEAPTGYGFGAAADRAVKQWRFAAGSPGLYVIEVRFRTDSATDGVYWSDLKPLPEPIHRVPVAYPAQARTAKANGKVRLAVSVLGDGSVAEATVVSEEPKDKGLGSAVREAVLLWRFDTGRAGVYRLTMALKAPD